MPTGRTGPVLPITLRAGDLIELYGHVVCDVDIDLPVGAKCEIVFVSGDGTIFEVKIPGVRETQIIPKSCMEWLMNEAAERRS